MFFTQYNSVKHSWARKQLCWFQENSDLDLDNIFRPDLTETPNSTFSKLQVYDRVATEIE